MADNGSGADLPPSYSSVRLASPRHARSSSRPPPATRTPRRPVDHQFSLSDSRNVPWATLSVTSNAISSEYLPSYFEGQPICGRFELNLSRPETIQAIIVTVDGTIVATNAPPFTFWEHTQTLWSSDMGDPRGPNASGSNYAGPSTSTSALSQISLTRSNTKLHGSYCWPFSITLPAKCEIAVRSKEPPTLVRLPPSFSEKGAFQFINYEITVRIRRGPLRIDSKVGTHFGYTPRTRPLAPSLLRRLSYQEGSTLHGPEGDPDGWQSFPAIPIRGKVFGNRLVDAHCSFHLALPLSYTRGTPIPCLLSVACSDKQALELIFTPASTSVHLFREVSYGTDQSPPLAGAGSPSTSGSSSSTYPRNLLSHATTSTPKQAPKLALRKARTCVASAVWWKRRNNSRSEVSEDGRAVLQMEGEIHIPKDLPPSFDFGPFKMKYSIVMLPFFATAFQPIDPADKEPVFLANVEIATLQAYGSNPRSYAPPGHEAQSAAHQQRVTKPVVWGLYNE